MIVAQFLVMILPGVLLAWSVLPRSSRGGALLDALAFGPILGCGLTTMFDLALRIVLDRPAAFFELALFAALIAVGSIPLACSRPGLEEPPHDTGPGLRLFALLSLIAALVLTAVIFAVRLASARDGGWDGMAVWGLLGRILHAAGGDPRLALETITLTQTDYPPLLPGSLAILHGAAGFDSSLPGRIMAWTGFLSLPLVAQRILVRLAGATRGHLGALLLLTTPCFLLRASEQYADVLVATLNLAVVGLVTLALGDRRGRLRYLVLAGLLLGLLGWTKAEGTLLALVILGAALVATGRGAGRARSTLIAASLPGLAATAAFFGLVAPRGRRLDGSLGGAVQNLFDLERWNAAIVGFGREFATVLPFHDSGSFDPAGQRWGYYFGASALLALIRFGRGLPDRPGRFLIAVVLVQLGAFVAIFALIPERQAWQIDNALHRLLLQVAPLFVLIGLGGRREDRRDEEQGVEER